MLRHLPTLLLCALLTACSSNERRVHIITNCNKAVKNGDEAVQVTLSDPGLYHRSQDIEFTGSELTLTDGSRTKKYMLPKPGHYVINFSPDTLLSNPAEYVREIADGFDFSDASIDPENWTPSGNAKADSIMARAAKAKAMARERKQKEREASGRTGPLIIYPDSMTRISANSGASVQVLQDAPKRIEGKTADEIEYYEVNTLRYWKQRLLSEMESEMNQRKNPYGRY